MTSDTATRRQAGYRRVLRHMAENTASGVVPTNPPDARGEPRVQRAVEKMVAAMPAGRMMRAKNMANCPDFVIVPSAHMGATIAGTDCDRRRILESRIEDSARDALNVVKACARPDIVYDFSSETTQVGESFTVTMTFTPRTK